MKVFFVRVGKKTRGGNFQEFHSQVVSVSDETDKYQVSDYFTPRYTGFEVIVDKIEAVDISENIPSKPKPKADRLDIEKKIGFLKYLSVKYTDAEKQLFDEYRELVNRTENKLQALENAIKYRYQKLSYVDEARSYLMEVSTDYNGTTINNLPIKSGDFFKVVKNCVEDDNLVEDKLFSDDAENAESSEELVIEPIVSDGENFDHDIPF
jgi:hypothetical protein